MIGTSNPIAPSADLNTLGDSEAAEGFHGGKFFLFLVSEGKIFTRSIGLSRSGLIDNFIGGEVARRSINLVSHSRATRGFADGRSVHYFPHL